MKAEDLTKFREKHFPEEKVLYGRITPERISQEKMGKVFGVKYNTLRRYEGENPSKIPMVLQKSIQFFEEKEVLKKRLE